MHSNIVIVPVDEEYGFKGWFWVFPGTTEELVEYWKSIDGCVLHASEKSDFPGKFIEAKGKYAYEAFNIMQRKYDVMCDCADSTDLDFYSEHLFVGRKRYYFGEVDTNNDDDWEV
jgi:hypothetical protein